MNFKGVLDRIEAGALVGALTLFTALPLIDAVGRPLGGFHIPGSASYLQHLTLWLTFLGGLLAAGRRAHLKLSMTEMWAEGGLRSAATLIGSTVAAAVCAVLARASMSVVEADREMGSVLPIGLPEWVSECVMPAALGLMAVRFILQSSNHLAGKLTALAGVAAAFGLHFFAESAGAWTAPMIGFILLAAILGAPMFVAMGGIALFLFFKDGTPVAAVPAEIYRLIASPTLPAIPLLTACGYILAESKASERLVRFFRAIFGWMPGGVSVLVLSVCVLFTTFTGGSGVTIIALGGLVLPILLKDGYPEGFSIGLVTAAGSLGLLFPPSLPVILYSVVANVPADQLYLAGLVPGLLLVVIVAVYSSIVGFRMRAARQTFSGREALAAFWEAKWELSVPVLVIVLFGTGMTSMVEAAAAACAYSVLIECFIFRDIHVTRGLPTVLLKSATLVGAVLMLLSTAMGLTSYLVDAQIPDLLLAEVQSRIDSPVVFLLALNALLLVLGSVLEIYSGIVILAPLLVPMGLAYGIDPVHLGIIFLANLELGFIFPPVGLNLLLASSRFGKPLTSLYRHVWVFLLIRGAGVLLITYLPQLSTGILRWMGRYP
ncbi:TRAP transporter large permease subunit [bacterium]|nr:TRAP transporter large permease subunit [bacterium]